ncbi:GNAT family N-acetyltransferase [Stackebrandtia nassauensis]|uniref:GCN5-related N-acetyltransferase n=1 Tax=Stackebrandtia nassauensis (strain DSM 44728 / CIP 108903 / NRRL B-16338 / NBRC 102104 / LLR-40K-21) TaxID=446470 RepID=D3Q7N4_STANL|nr:GNAT family N-acetyltransferase [Stackebrandtia nassauensis]ADD44376.1 GCN5-related N-acetyltransferase [Stackebrandtia nassauensis DSM 44728]
MNEIDTSPRAREYLDAYNDQLRDRMFVNDPDEETVDVVGPVKRLTKIQGRGFIMYKDLGGLDGEALDAFIAEQRDYFAGLGKTVEWKYHVEDQPADLPDRLAAHGFEPEELESIVIGEAADHMIAVRLPEGVTVREITSDADLERVRAMEEKVWDTPMEWLPKALAAELKSTTDPVTVLVAEADGEVVCAAWIRCHKGTEFASLWGGSTLPGWRGKGIYRALVARRAQLAVARGFKYLQFDCSDESRPILLRMGMSWVTKAFPYVWKPQDAAAE